MTENDFLKNYRKSPWHTFDQIRTYASYSLEKKNDLPELKEGQLLDDTQSTF